MPNRYTLRKFLFGMAALLLACGAGAASLGVAATPKTVCTVTINSSDEKDTFVRHLPRGQYRVVELVRRGQPNWLESARRSGVVCDALLISGHFDDGTEFYTDRFDDREFLTVHELQRASCSASGSASLGTSVGSSVGTSLGSSVGASPGTSGSGLFSQLKEVYLFGCNTLKSDPRYAAPGEVRRSLAHAGHAPADIERISALLSERYGQSNRDRLRHVFKDVPVLYGFSSKAPLGRVAGPLLERYFQSAPTGEVASGQVSPTLLKLFGPSSMIAVSGLTGADPHAGFRTDLCSLADEGLSDVRRLTNMHQVLQREMSEVRMLLDQLEHYVASLDPAKRLLPEVAAALGTIERDQRTRERFLAFARDADEATVQTRMMSLAGSLRWLTPVQERAEFLHMIGQRMARGSFGPHEVDHVCSAPAQREPGEARQLLLSGAAKASNLAHAAALGCLGDLDAHERTVRALSSAREEDVALAQIYLRHRQLANVAELRAVTTGIGRMSAGPAQVRALETLARQHPADTQSLQAIAELFPLARSLDAQRAIAGILIRADHRLLMRFDLARTLRQQRIPSPGGNDIIDALIRVLQPVGAVALKAPLH